MHKAYLIDMDGVLTHGKTLVTGAAEFIERLRFSGAPFSILTNNSRLTPQEFVAQFHTRGLNVPVGSVFTSAIATVHFLKQQQPNATIYMLGESGLRKSLREAGFVLTDEAPDYVVLGETIDYSFERATTAIRFIAGGARFIATNSDTHGPGAGGIVPATGAVAAMITTATDVRPYFFGKPNPLMMRLALRQLGVHSDQTIMISDNMKTDIMAGLESGMETVLVLSGVTTREDIERYPYRPTRIVESVGDVIP